MFWQHYRLRTTLALCFGGFILVCIGIGETWRCVRSLFPAGTLTYAQACQEGLGAYGYVRITQVHPLLDGAKVISSRRSQEWEGAYIPIGPAPGTPPGGGGAVMASMPRATRDEDLLPLLDATEIVGFVDTTFEHLNPGHQDALSTMRGGDPGRCWVVDISPPSWLRGVGCVLGGLAMPGALLLMRMRRPLSEMD